MEKKYTRIAHMADVHFMNNLSRLTEQKHVADKTVESIKEQSPDLIVISGDLFHDYVRPFNEVRALAADFLYKLTEIAEVVITDGNHDLMKLNLQRHSSIKNLVDIMKNPKIHYLNQTKMYEMGNLVFACWYHPDRKSPWLDFTQERDPNKTYIDIFHDPIQGCSLETGSIYENGDAVSLSDFKGDIVMAGDIHLFQVEYKNKKPFFCYPSSLYCTKYSEGNNSFHGYVIWDLSLMDLEPIEIKSDYKYFNVKIEPDFDYDDITISFDELGVYNYIMIRWLDYKVNATVENKKKIIKYFKDTFNITDVKFDETKLLSKNSKIEDEASLIDLQDTVEVEKLMIKFLQDNKCPEKLINDILLLDKKITELTEMETTNVGDVSYSIDKLVIDNFKSNGEEFELDLSDKNGIIQISGENQAGKCLHPSTRVKIRYGLSER